jgi:hypothetical protein
MPQIAILISFSMPHFVKGSGSIPGLCHPQSFTKLCGVIGHLSNTGYKQNANQLATKSD